MANVKILLQNIELWAKTNKLDITRELNSIHAKLNVFLIAEHKKKAKTQHVESTKPSKQRKIYSRKKRSPEYLKSNIDFEKSSKIIKGLSVCNFCENTRLECFQYPSMAGVNKLVICLDCKLKKRRNKETKQNNFREKSNDALDHRVSGSMGTGKYGR